MEQLDLFVTEDHDLVVCRAMNWRRATEAEVKAWLQARGWRVRRPREAPYAAGSDTSKEAADAILPRVGTLQAMVLELIQASRGGLTCDQVEAQMGGKHQTVSARVYELKNKGLIMDSGRRRLTRSGRKAVVWVCGS